MRQSKKPNKQIPKRSNNEEGDLEFKQYKTDVYYDEAKHKYTIYIMDAITAPSDYVNVFDVFDRAIDGDTIEVWFSTPGGRKDTLDLLRAAAVRTEAYTKAILGDVASAGTIIPLVFDDLEALPNSEYMCHNYSGAAFGKHHELITQADFMKKEMPECFRRYYKDFLTPDEIEYVIAGNDMYFNADEVNHRWTNVIRAREAEIEEIAALDREEAITEHLESLALLGYTIPTETAKEPTKNAKSKTNK